MRYLLTACCAAALAVGTVSAESGKAPAKGKTGGKPTAEMKAKPKGAPKNKKKAVKTAVKKELKEKKGEAAEKSAKKKVKKQLPKKKLKTHEEMNALETAETPQDPLPAEGDEMNAGEESMERTPAETGGEDDLPPID